MVTIEELAEGKSSILHFVPIANDDVIAIRLNFEHIRNSLCIMELIYAVLDPLALFSILLVSWLLLRFSGVDFSAREVMFPVFLLLLLMIISAPAVVNPLLTSYEARLTEYQCENTEGLPIVVLGGGVDGRAESPDQIEYMKPATFDRVIGAYRLAQLSPSSDIYLSGGEYRMVAESKMMANFLGKLGIDSNRVVLDDVSRNTFENAVEVRQLLQARGMEATVLLVTSAVHMYRASASFRSMGVEVCPAAVGYLGLHDVPAFALLPQSSALRKTAALLHEVIGWGYYKATRKL